MYLSFLLMIMLLLRILSTALFKLDCFPSKHSVIDVLVKLTESIKTGQSSSV